ncbi:S8 family serine peptidase [Sinomicrobium kalidii]|uniref:S8 family serine peptidase n=1 Tax=Sinomicrobium kalidii TaxID=2900738 RepID=UPI001E2E1FEC|nr:S8 family serine peptidase [Sinomicrobium kalidii]UGU14446.1 S8 family serine peptidase [Sinomicrobium kalidii]
MTTIRTLIYIAISWLLWNCSPNKTSSLSPVSVDDVLSKKAEIAEKELNNWQHKDYLLDTIPGISLDRAYKEILEKKKGIGVIVAVLDTEIDIAHEALKNNIWINPNEVSDNGIDDDGNGYEDDVHGWNFLGNSQGENIIHTNYEVVRIVRKYEEKFKNKSEEEIPVHEREEFSIYVKARKVYEEKLKEAKDNQEYGDFLVNTYPKSKEALKKFFPKEDYTVEQLDSLYALKEKEDKELASLIYYMSDYIKYNLTQEWIYAAKDEGDASMNYWANIEYDDRKIIGDDPEDITDTGYGNNEISTKNGLEKVYPHGTYVAGLLVASQNSRGVRGISDRIKIMPVRMSPYGAAHDKDIALAIRYAVDNGAKVINMSFSKKFSLHKEWVFDAIRYAAEKNVLLVTSAGNDGINIDEFDYYYPNDAKDSMGEVADNFLIVGAITPYVNENLVVSYSNYGRHNVDVFAPGYELLTTAPDNSYKQMPGTSLASAIVSGVAALIWSYYPDLSASQVKKIIMDSGLSYNIECNIPGNETKEKLLFREFSQSGKVVNAYNALLMAREISTEK